MKVQWQVIGQCALRPNIGSPEVRFFVSGELHPVFGSRGWGISSLLDQGRAVRRGHLFVFRGRRGGLIKVLWHDGQGMCLYAKRLERGHFIWPSPADGAVTITPSRQADC